MRFRNVTVLWAAVCLAGAPLLCQQSERSELRGSDRPAAARFTTAVRGPMLGFRYENGRGLQPVVGIPGSARLGPAILAAGRLEDAAVSPACCFAIGVAGEQRRLLLIRNSAGEGAASEVAGVPSGVSRVVLSPSGRSALVYYRDTQRVVALRGLPDAPAVAWRKTLAGLTGPLEALAISDDAFVGLASHPQGLLRISAAEGWRRLGPLAGPVSISFSPHGHDAAIAERQANRVSLVRNVLTGGGIVPIADSRSGISLPVAVAITADGARLVVANADPPGVTEVRLSDRMVTTVPARWAPRTLDRLAGNAVFLLGRSPGGPLALYDGDSPRRRIALVAGPRADRTAVEGGEQ